MWWFLVFSSIEFLLFFLPIFLIIYSITPKRIKNMTLLSGSLIFYAYGELKFLPLLLLSIVMNYFFGLHLGRREQYRTEQANAETGIESRLRTNKVKARCAFGDLVGYNCPCFVFKSEFLKVWWAHLSISCPWVLKGIPVLCLMPNSLKMK